MTKEIATHYIFLDTSIFIKENFFAGNKLKAFLKHEQESEIKLFTTEITTKECIENLLRNFNDSYNTLKKVLKELNNKAKVFKNVESLNSVFGIQNSFDFEEESKQIKERFEKLISDHFEEIDIDNLKTSKVLDDYFSYKPPFCEGKKKYEFPDALVLNSLESWCEKNKAKIYIVADDGDLNSYKSDYLIPIKEYDKLLELISYTFSEENINQKIDEIIESNESDIISSIETIFIDEFPTDGFDDSQGFEYETNGVEKFEAYIEHHSVLQIFDNIATVELSVPVDYTADISYEDTNSGWYDKEDGRWYGTDSYTKEISGECNLKVIVEIEFELPGQEAIWKDWELSEISSGIPTDISIDY